MNSALFRILIAVLLIAVTLGLGLCVFASQTNTVSKDGITATLLTDKDSYSANEPVRVSLKVTNHSKYTALLQSDVSVPDGMSVSSGSTKGEASVNRGAETTFTLELQATNPLSFILWTVGIVLVLGIIGAVVFFGLKARNRVSIIVCLILAGTVLLSMFPLQVHSAGEQLSLSRTVMVNGKAVTVSATISVELVTPEYERQDLERLLATTAWAYFLKEDKLQYCSQEITDGLSKYTGGNYRLTEDAAPEYGTSDTTIYSVCSDFVYKVYYEALGHRLFDAENYLGSTTSDFWLKSEDVALMRWFNASYMPDELETELNNKYGVTKDKELSTEQARKFMENWKENLRPGDVIVATGHAFLYVGNGYVMDCWGDKYNESTGLDQIEANGSVHVLHTIEALFLNGQDPITQSFVIKHNSEKDWLVVFRPLDGFVKTPNTEDKGADVIDLGAMTVNPDKIEAAFTRLANPAMEIDRTVDVTPYGSVATGGKLTYSIAISNKSNDPDFLTYNKRQDENYAGTNYTGLVVTETIPEGTTVVNGSISGNGKLENGVITWTLDMAAGETVTLSYTVDVTADMGSTIVNNGGYVGNIASNSISTTVGGQKLSAQALENLAKLAATPKALWRETYNISKLGTDLEFAERVYQAAMGIGLELPSIEEILNNLFDFQTVENESCSDRYPAPLKSNLFIKKDTVSSQWQSIFDMMVAGYYGGQNIYEPVRGNTINEFSFDYLEAGDILVYANVDIVGQPKYTEVMVYAGNGTLLILDSKQTSTVTTAFSHNNADLAYAKLWNALARGVFFVLRPTEAYEDINTLTYDTSREPVYGEEPLENNSGTQLGSQTLNQDALNLLATLTAENVDIWTITLLDNQGTATLATQHGKYLSRAPGSSNLRQSDTPVNWVITKDETTGYYTITNENGDIRYLSYNGTGFKAYTEASNTRYIQFLLIPAEEIGKEVDEDAEAPVYELKTGKYAIVAMAGYHQYILQNTMQSENVYGATEVTVDDGILTTPGWTQKNTNFAEEIYKKLGIDITSGTLSTSIANILKTALFFDADGVDGYPYEYDLLATPAETYKQLSAMLVPELRGGPGMARYTDNYITIQDLVPGDILNLINREDSRYWVCVYMGDGKLLTSEYTKNSRQTYKIYDFSQDTDGSEFKEFITNAAIGGFTWECYYVLRPSNGFYNINDPLYDPNLVVPTLTTKTYAILAKVGNDYYALVADGNGYIISANKVDFKDGVITGAYDIWTIDTKQNLTSGLTVTVACGNSYIYQKESGSSNMSLRNDASSLTNWRLVYDKTAECYRLQTTSGDGRYLMYSINNAGFKVYADENSTQFGELMMVPVDPSSVAKTDKYVLIAKAGDKYFAVSNSMADTVTMGAVELTYANGVFSGTNVDFWNMTQYGASGNITLATVSGKYLTRAEGSANLKLSDTAANWTLTKDATTGMYTIRNSNGDTRYLSYNGTGFKAYAKATDSRFIEFFVVPAAQVQGVHLNEPSTDPSTDPTIDLETGKYHVVAVAGDKYYALGNSGSSGIISAVQVTIENGKVTTSGAPAWTISMLDKNGTATLATPEGKYLLRTASKSNLNIVNNAENWTIAKDGNYYTITSTSGDTRFLAYTDSGFKAYTKASADRFVQFLLIPASETEGGNNQGGGDSGNDSGDGGGNEEIPPEAPSIDLESGNYHVIAVAGDKYFAMGNATTASNSGIISATEVTVVDGVLTSDGAPVWTITVLDSDGTIALTFGEKYVVRGNKSSNLAVGSTETLWKLAKDGNYYTIANTNGDTRFLAYQGTGFKAYAAASDTRFIQFLLIPVHEHSWDEGTITTPASCSNEGTKTYTCGTCGKTKEEAIPTTSHTDEVIPAVDASCTETGLTAGVKCSVCGEILTAPEETPVLEHTEEVIPPVGATCEDTGLTAGAKCSVCGEILTAQEDTPALGHSWDEETGKCSVCTQTRCDSNGHTEETIPAVGATCTETGLTAGVKCSVCGEILTAQKEVAATGHTEETIPAVGATCTETGLTAGVKCSVCGEILTAQKEVAATGHTEETIPAVGATCIKTGLTAGVKCSVCSEILTAQETTPITDHTWNNETGTCSVCGKVAINLQSGNYHVIAVAGDKYFALGNATTGSNSGIISATEVTVVDSVLTSDGAPVWTITVLDSDGTIALTFGEKYVVRGNKSSNLAVGSTETLWKLAKDGNYYTIANTNGDTRFLAYQGTGFKAYTAASDTRFIQFLLIPVHEHSWDEGTITTPASCSNEGTKTFTCGTCGKTREEAIPTTAHSWVNGDCANCDEILYATQINSLDELTSGDEYMVVVKYSNGNYYAMTSTASGGVVSAQTVTVTDGKVQVNDSCGWTINVGETGADNLTVTLTADNRYLANYSSSNMNVRETAYDWTMTYEDNSFRLKGVASSRYLAYQGSGFKAYAEGSDTRYITLLLFKIPS